MFLPVVEAISYAISKGAEVLNSYQQYQPGRDETEIDTSLNSIRVTNEGESKAMGVVNEMINEASDDRSNISPADQVILVVEDDLRFGKIIIEKAH